MRNASYELEKKIAECNCSKRTGGSPFYFPIRKAKIMIISACPSYQAAYRPLTSVRFFRQLVYALLGFEGISERGLMHFFTGDIYWTHNHKCYCEDFYKLTDDGFYAMTELSKDCHLKYIYDEVKIVNPELIIVMGKANANELGRGAIKPDRLLECEYMDRLCICVDYPQKCDASVYDELRKRVSGLLRTPEPEQGINLSLLNTARVNNAVSLTFEQDTLKKLRERFGLPPESGTQQDGNLIDEKWQENVIVPLKLRQCLSVQYWDLMESQIAGFLANEYSPQRKNHKSMINIINGQKSVDVRDVPAFLSDKWQIAFNKFIDACVDRDSTSGISGMNEYVQTWKKLEKKIDLLKPIRNLLVHSEGLLPRGELYLKDAYNPKGWTGRNRFCGLDYDLSNANIQGIELLTNLVYITNVGVDSFHTLFVDVAKLIADLDKDLT